MIRIIRNIAFIMMLVLLMAGCSAKEPVTYPMETDIYSPAVAQLEAAGQISMTVTAEKTLSFAGETIREKQTEDLLYILDHPTVHATGTIQYGDHSIQTTRFYQDGTLYLTLDESRFRGSLSLEEALLVPVRMLDPGLYGTVTVCQTEELTELLFTDPTAPESWALPEGGKMTSTLATAALNPSGSLRESMYEITYELENIAVTSRFHVQYNLLQDITPLSPVPEEYQLLEQVQGPLLAEKAYGYLLQTRYMDAELTQSIFSEANSLQYDQQLLMNRSSDGINIETITALTDASRGGEVSKSHQLESFQDGIYTIATDGGEPQEQSRIDSQDMNTYCANLLTEKILSSRHIIGCQSQLTDNLLTITYTAGESLAELICQESCQTIYQDSGFLDSQTDFYEEYAVSFILTVDQITGLPVSSGLDFKGIHNIEGINYQLVTTYRQLYTFTAE